MVAIVKLTQKLKLNIAFQNVLVEDSFQSAPLGLTSIDHLV